MKGKIFFALTTILVASLGATILSTEALSYDPKFDQRRRELEARHRQKVAEFERKFNQGLNSTGSTSHSQSYSSKKPPQRSPFDPRVAPDPKLCVMKFVQVAKSATSMEQIYPYLSDSLATKMRKYEASGADPDYSRKKLIEYRKLAASVIKVNKTSWKRLKDVPPSASVYVTRRVNKKVNGHLFKDRGCDFRMVGQNNYWKFDAYGDSLWLHD